MSIFVIAEIGINHNGSMEITKQLIDMAKDAGCDAVVAEGFEAGGHNAREETTTLVLVPSVVNTIKIPVIAAGGLYSGMLVYIEYHPTYRRFYALKPISYSVCVYVSRPNCMYVCRYVMYV
jgi:hypothetical protein